jgi:hypothetical protein
MTKRCLIREDNEDFSRLNIGSRLESVATPTVVEESTATTTMTTRHRLKRPRLEIDDDDVIIANGNGH